MGGDLRVLVVFFVSLLHLPTRENTAPLTSTAPHPKLFSETLFSHLQSAINKGVVWTQLEQLGIIGHTVGLVVASNSPSPLLNPTSATGYTPQAAGQGSAAHVGQQRRRHQPTVCRHRRDEGWLVSLPCNLFWFAHTSVFQPCSLSSTLLFQGDYTRTGRRNLKGVFADHRKSVARFYHNNFRDSYRQTAIDVLQAQDDFDGADQTEDGGGGIVTVVCTLPSFPNMIDHRLNLFRTHRNTPTAACTISWPRSARP